MRRGRLVSILAERPEGPVEKFKARNKREDRMAKRAPAC
jgi:hypothetical protein